jgi:hypothetical protein
MVIGPSQPASIRGDDQLFEPRLALKKREFAQVAPVVVLEIEGPHAEVAIVSIVTAGQLSNELRTLWNVASIRGL